MKSKEINPKGQALIEFSLVLPILLFILLASYFVGTSLYAGANAATALQGAMGKKIEYANSETAINKIESNINSISFGTFQLDGKNIDDDGLAVINETKETAVLVARKSVKLPILPRFDFFVTHGITSDLLKNNVPPFTSPSVIPFSASVPASYNSVAPATYEFTSSYPSTLSFSGGCSVSGGSLASLAATNLNPDPLIKLANSQNFSSAYINQVFTFAGYSACGDTVKGTNDVTFKVEANPY